jgi:four helix bundle protein
MLAMSFRKLNVWVLGMKLARSTYTLTQKFPKQETYGLISQMRSAAVSIPSNIAEGSQRVSDKEFSNFILIARGSLAELQTQLLLALDLQYGNTQEIENILKEYEQLSRMLHSLYSKLKAHSS